MMIAGRDDIFLSDCGEYVYWVRATGYLHAVELRIIADILDERNATLKTRDEALPPESPGPTPPAP